VFALAGLARLAVDWGDLRAAARLLGATADHPAYRRTSAVQVMSQLKEDATALRAELGEEAFATAWAQGGSMNFDEVVAYALTLELPATARGEVSVLTAREQEVARLIAKGKTNREIATALVIAEPTAERHVANILSKLGFHTRAQIAVWHERQASASLVESGHSVQ
jgi:non-specific serine/threonine protein kinase